MDGVRVMGGVKGRVGWGFGQGFDKKNLAFLE